MLFDARCTSDPCDFSVIPKLSETSEQCRRDQIMPDAPDRILRLKAVLEVTGLTRSALYRKMHHGTFPRNIKISTRCIGWRESAIGEWMRNPIYYDADEHRPD